MNPAEIVSPWLGRAVFLAGLVATIVIRHPHDETSKKTKIADDRRGRLELALLALMMLGTLLLPLASLTPLLAFADYSLALAPLAAGCGVMAFAIWLFYRSHADLGKNWSMTLQIREEHRIVSSGVYAHIRHPMYAALFALACAQTLLLPNWIAGPACLEAFTLMFALRLGPEERMMLERFGPEYRSLPESHEAPDPGRLVKLARSR